GRGANILTLERECAAVERCGDHWYNQCGQNNFDCAAPGCSTAPECAAGGACVVTEQLSCATSQPGTTFTGTSRFDDLLCLTRATPGSEATYKLDAPAGSVTITIDNQDVDMVVVDGDLQ